MRSDLHDIEVIYQHRTERAVCVRETEDGPDIWIPLSLCEIEPKGGDLFGGLSRGRPAILTAPERVLVERGLV
ncbi:hypothetical protein OEW28_18795 [Defluviimonas sp. WL0002]|uniref:Uncharacterized protein n=1 Tax=Albidovulum marisflavi TaxID=2984159 RepID=A0ABT2ZHS5_9RHOB|nr:hypothetical protein [Defluviimonas sp. WL0002]MCV2870666.1 hypothetical protein [Defluviimonas sp. WL0002]